MSSCVWVPEAGAHGGFLTPPLRACPNYILAARPLSRYVRCMATPLERVSAALDVIPDGQGLVAIHRGMNSRLTLIQNVRTLVHGRQ